MPADDVKNVHYKPFNYVELYDGIERVELFRIIGSDLTRSTQAATVYTCEHVLATLILNSRKSTTTNSKNSLT